jgi:peptidyl-prolyl cis-trans isomerase C
MSGRSVAAAVLLISISVVACSKKTPPPEGAAAGGPVTEVARIGNRKITSAELDELMASLPQHVQGEFAGARGRVRLLEQMVNRELLVQAARDEGLPRDPEIAKQLRDHEANVLTQAYQARMVANQPQPTEDDIRKYYDAHAEEFTVQARVNASWIQCKTRADASKAHRRVTSGQENFGNVAREMSIHEETAADGGLLGYFNPTGYVRGLGNRPDFSARAFAVEQGGTSDVFEFDGTYGIIRVHEKSEARAEPFERARERIFARLKPTLTDSLYQSEVARLRERYKAKILIDLDQELEGKSADEMMKLATETQNPMDKIEYYRALLRKYPHYERAAEAQFMIGFMFSEELHNAEAARKEYDKVLQNYPTSEVAESARYMMTNLNNESLPQFEEAPPAP